MKQQRGLLNFKIYNKILLDEDITNYEIFKIGENQSYEEAVGGYNELIDNQVMFLMSLIKKHSKDKIEE